MALTEHQTKIINYANSKGGIITKKEACGLFNYYANGSKHTGDVLSRMVNSNILKRIKNGVFEVSTGKKTESEQIDPNQLEMF